MKAGGDSLRECVGDWNNNVGSEQFGISMVYSDVIGIAQNRRDSQVATRLADHV